MPTATSPSEVASIAADRAKYSGEYFHVIGVKTFLDGVTEAHTAWQNQDYLDQPGYHGNERFNNHDKMVQLIAAADAEAGSPTMLQQLACHQLGARSKATWNLEPWRPDVDPFEMIAARCNPT